MGSMNGDFTVLLAQGDPDHRHEFHLVMNGNYTPPTIREADDGEEVIEYLRGEGKFANREKFPIPDLLILDLNMPKAGGLDILRWLRRHPEFCRLVTVMLSGSGEKKEIAEAYRLGACSYFKKPRDFNRFMKMLNTIFDYWLLNGKIDGNGTFDPATLPRQMLEILG
jgi:CheY-like chemotaxis protein